MPKKLKMVKVRVVSSFEQLAPAVPPPLDEQETEVQVVAVLVTHPLHNPELLVKVKVRPAPMDTVVEALVQFGAPIAIRKNRKENISKPKAA